MAGKLMVVIPCYNEEEVLPETSRRLVEKMNSLVQKGLAAPDSRVLLVNDGSREAFRQECLAFFRRLDII